MTSQTPAPTLQQCRTCGGGAPVDVHFCPQCSKLLTLGRHGDFFTFLGLPRKLGLDAESLEQRFRALSRQFHPDFFHNASAAERRASLERSSYLNDAYRTLRDPERRLEYLIQLERPADDARKAGPSGGANAKLPPSLLQEFFELNEELDEIRQERESGAPDASWRPRLERARHSIAEKQAEREARLSELSAAWDALVERGADAPDRAGALTSLHERVLERNYIKNLLDGIERELSR